MVWSLAPSGNSQVRETCRVPIRFKLSVMGVSFFLAGRGGPVYADETRLHHLTSRFCEQRHTNAIIFQKNYLFSCAYVNWITLAKNDAVKETIGTTTVDNIHTAQKKLPRRRDGPGQIFKKIYLKNDVMFLKENCHPLAYSNRGHMRSFGWTVSTVQNMRDPSSASFGKSLNVSAA